MNRIIGGATGLIGKHLVEFWRQKGHNIIVIGRSQQRIKKVFGNGLQALTWDDLSSDVFQSAEVVINLAGANIAEKPWTPARKEEILSSRIETTKKITALLVEMGSKAPRLFTASALSVYGPQVHVLGGLPPHLDESAAIDWESAPNFLTHVAHQLEIAVQPAIAQGVRVVFLRFGAVLAKSGGVLPPMLRLFQFFMGGRIGTGDQPFSWITIDDVVRAIDFLVTKPELSGPINMVAPGCVTQYHLAQIIGKVLHRPAVISSPAFLMKLLLGERSQLLLEGQHLYPQRLLEEGFKFYYPELEQALRHILLED